MKKLDLLENKLKSILYVVFLVFIDQISKYYTRIYLKNGNITIIDDFLRLTYIENRGAAFGIMQGGQYIFATISLFVLAILIFYYKQLREKKLEYLNILSYIIIFIIAGAVGNLIDRLTLGFVVDMIDFYGIWVFVFNVADIFVVCGFISLFIYIILFDKESK